MKSDSGKDGTFNTHNGFFAGVPGFLGNLRGVSLSFETTTTFLPFSPGK
jgi:hypothetical protein